MTEYTSEFSGLFSFVPFFIFNFCPSYNFKEFPPFNLTVNVIKSPCGSSIN